MRILKDVERVTPVARAAQRVRDGVLAVRVHAVNAEVDFVVEEELPDVH